MEWHDRNWSCRCEADITQTTSMIQARRGNPLKVKRAMRVRHFREKDQAHFWHWSDQNKRLTHV